MIFDFPLHAKFPDLLTIIDHQYPAVRVRLFPYLCTISDDAEPQPLAAQRLRWVEAAELRQLPFPAANASLIAGRIPGAQLVLVPDTSHGWMLQDLNRFVSLLTDFSAGRPVSPSTEPPR